MVSIKKIDVCVKEFIKYSKKFDLKEPSIMYKFHHTFRVMEYCKDIAKSEGLSEDDVSLAQLCGLLHDIGRYKQWTKYHTYNDSKSFDHGLESYKIMKNNNYISKYTKNKIEQNIIYKALINHNKYSIDEQLKGKELLMAKIVRDADKLDIIKEQGNTLDVVIENPNEELIRELKEEKLCNNIYVSITHDSVLRELGFIYDLNFKYSYLFIKNEKIVEQKIDLLERHIKNIKPLETVKKILLEYIDTKIK